MSNLKANFATINLLLHKKMESNKIYSFEEAYQTSLKYFDGDELAARVWVNKYAMKDSFGHIFECSPEDMHRRIANEVARIEAKYKNPMNAQEIFEMLDHFKYIVPAGSPMTGIGNSHQVASLSNCFVIGLEGKADSYGAIMRIDEEQVQLMKRRGGVGHDLSHIRPKGSPVNNSALTSTGLVPFMERYSNSTREVAQDGRRGALMLSVSIKHPDSEAFIDAKMEEGKVTGANVSVKLDDEFMQAAVDDRNYMQQWPIDAKEPKITKEISARKLWEKIVHNAWKSAEPGEMEKIDLIIHKIKEDPENDDVKEAEYHLWEKIKHKSGMGRRTGVGITAEGDMLAALGLRYGTQEATDFSVSVHKTLALNAYRSSVTMARERGAFEIYDAKREVNNPFVQRIKEADPELFADMQQYGRRNIACLTIAPTGTTSLMTQTTSGIEPVFMPVYKRRRKVNPNDADVHVDFVDEVGDSFEEYIVYHRKFLQWMQVNGYDTEKRYTQEEIDHLVAKSPYYKATANDVDWLMKVKMQGAIQKWVDHSISVTVNLPHDVDESLVNRLYVEAWKSGCKGCTIYRDGSRAGVMISVSKKDKKKGSHTEGADVREDTPKQHECVRPEVTEVRPKELECDVVRFQNNKEKWVAFVGLLNGYPYEIFTGLQDDEEGIVLPKNVTKGKIIKSTIEDGSHRYDFQFENKRGYKTTVEGLSEKFNPEYWNYAKLISGVLRYRMPIDHVMKLVSSLQLKDESINTWKNGVERALKKYIVDGTKANGQKCPVCGHETLVYQEGCLICTNCGASRCG